MIYVLDAYLNLLYRSFLKWWEDPMPPIWTPTIFPVIDAISLTHSYRRQRMDLSWNKPSISVVQSLASSACEAVFTCCGISFQYVTIYGTALMKGPDACLTPDKVSCPSTTDATVITYPVRFKNLFHGLGCLGPNIEPPGKVAPRLVKLSQK